MKHRLPLAVFLGVGVLCAHPMGNFSVSHYTRLEVTARGVEIKYILDLAEIPTFQLLQQWKLEATSPREEIEKQVEAQAREWSRNLHVEIGGRAVSPSFVHADYVLDKGAGGLPILRVTSDLHVDADLVRTRGSLQYEDKNFADRAGWKEIVMAAGKNAAIDQAAPNTPDRSQALTAYPQDPLLAPPQDLHASVDWHAVAPVVTQTAAAPAVRPSEPAKGPTTSLASETEPAIPVGPPAPVGERQTTKDDGLPHQATAGPSAQPGQIAPGMVVKGDFLSRLLHQGDISLGMMIVGLVVAFGLGSIHALSPGHGKTIVAAYLVGSRGTPKHAIFLGGMVTFTHTISVFFAGFVVLYLQQYVLTEKIFPVLGAISGLSIVWIGGALFYRRIRLALGHTSSSHHHPHDHGGLVHDHGDGHVHSHVPEGDVSMASLIALGASGGLVPCPSAMVLLLSSVALNRVALGLTLIVAFSLGLAVVLSVVGLVVLYAKHLIPDRQKRATSFAFRYLPVASAAIITCAGIIMTGVALGVIRPFAGV